MSFVRAFLLCIAFADVAVADLHDDHGLDHHSGADYADEDGGSDLDAGQQQHGSSGHDADLHFVAIDLMAPASGPIPFQNAERCFGDCLNRLGPVLPRDPDPERA